jgi:hypothetical protein
MNENKNIIDGLAKEKLFDFEVPPPVDSWRKIENQLVAKKSRLNWIVYTSFAASIALILTLGLGYYLGSNQIFLNKKSNNSHSINQTSTGRNNLTNKTESNSIGEQKIVTNFSTNKKKLFAINSIPATNKQHYSEVAQTSSTKKNVLSTALTTRKDSISQLKSISVNSIHVSKIPMNQLSDIYIETIKNTDNEFFTEEIPTKKNYTWTVGSNFGPQYAFRNISTNQSSYSTAYYNQSEKPLLAYTGGVNVSFESSRWQFETGIYFSKMGQEIKTNNNILASNEYSYNNTVTKVDVLSNNTVQNDKVVIQSSNGNIEADNTYLNSEQPVIGDRGFFLEPSKNTIPIEQSTVLQQYQYIEIPFLAHYKIIDKIADVSITGGLSTNFLINNRVDMENNNITANLGSTENIEKFNYAGLVGVSIQVPIISKLSFQIEPRFKYYINEINNSTKINAHLYSMCIYTGVNYRF